MNKPVKEATLFTLMKSLTGVLFGNDIKIFRKGYPYTTGDIVLDPETFNFYVTMKDRKSASDLGVDVYENYFKKIKNITEPMWIKHSGSLGRHGNSNETVIPNAKRYMFVLNYCDVSSKVMKDYVVVAVNKYTNKELRSLSRININMHHDKIHHGLTEHDYFTDVDINEVHHRGISISGVYPKGVSRYMYVGVRESDYATGSILLGGCIDGRTEIDPMYLETSDDSVILDIYYSFV